MIHFMPINTEWRAAFSDGFISTVDKIVDGKTPGAQSASIKRNNVTPSA
jgi:hypothetical protein